MADVATITTRIRNEVGDFGAPFRDDFTGAGELSSFDLSATNVFSDSVTVLLTVGGVTTTLVSGTDFLLDSREGRVVLLGSRGPLQHGQSLTVQGTAQGMFSDADLAQYITDAVNQHCYGRSTQTRYQDEHGFIRYTDDPVSLATLPAVEEPLVAYLAVVNVLWTLATDAAPDVDISTAEGTNVPRSERYRQLMEHIAQIQGRYNALAAQLNVGLGRIEVFTLRRVSRTTNRLEPIFREREYDDATWPQRFLPPVDEPDLDTSGVLSPWLPGVWG